MERLTVRSPKGGEAGVLDGDDCRRGRMCHQSTVSGGEMKGGGFEGGKICSLKYPKLRARVE